VAPARERTVGFIDIGTNAIRLMVVRLVPDHLYTVVTQQREPARLGEGEFVDRRLQPHAMDRAVLVCREFVELAHSHGAEEIVAVATSATREAVNGEEFLHRLREEAGLQVRMISGREEARLIYSGLAYFVHLDGKQAVFLDIGGGSTEVIVGGQHRYKYLDTIRVGAVRLTTMLLAPYEGLLVPPERYQLLRQHIRHAAVHTLFHVKEHPVDLLVGSSGTIQNLAAVAARSLRGRKEERDREERAEVLTYDDLRRVTAMLCAMPLEERRKVPGLNPERADIIIAGAAILDVVMEELGFSQIEVLQEGGLSQGLLMDYLAQTSGDQERPSVRARSVLRLGRACRFDEPHARNAERLALQLFDSARENGLHSYGAWERELLSYAALLHDIGAFLSYSNHHVHSNYLISNADLLGFYQTEIEIMALTALFHRKGLPTARNSGFAALDKDSRKLVEWLSLILRLVESLDRSHQEVVEEATLVASGPKHVTIKIGANGDAKLELWGIETREKAVQKTLGRKLRIEVNGSVYPPTPRARALRSGSSIATQESPATTPASPAATPESLTPAPGATRTGLPAATPQSPFRDQRRVPTKAG
jgi:exopolyphosphatase/guanosine-5'-triphosphate,3'-diphosphate pyrophosphatase